MISVTISVHDHEWTSASDVDVYQSSNTGLGDLVSDILFTAECRGQNIRFTTSWDHARALLGVITSKRIQEILKPKIAFRPKVGFVVRAV